MKRIVRKLATAILAGTLAFSMVPATVQAAGWKQNKNGYWWQENDYSYPKNQWKTIYGKQYHFNSGGYMDTDWTKIDGKWYYLGGKNDGAKKTYWYKVRGKFYWLGSNGVMRTGWQRVYNKKYYYLGGANDGAMKTGWQKISGKWYWLGNDGDMKSGWQTIYKKKYYLGGPDDGAMKTGWQQIGGYWYYFGKSGESNEGVLRTNTWVGNYYVDGNGRWDTSKTKKTDKQVLNEFISSGEYKRYTDGYSNLSYVITDINADSVPELLIQSAEGFGFYNTWVFALDGKKNIVKAAKEYGYGSFRYSSKYNVIAGSPETKPMPSAWYWPFYKLNGTKLEYDFTVYEKNELEKYSLRQFDWISLSGSTSSYSETDESQPVVQSVEENETLNEASAVISEEAQSVEQDTEEQETEPEMQETETPEENVDETESTDTEDTDVDSEEIVEE